jgi:TolB-like protein/Tfp pilus assembly protein PilF
MKEPNLPYSYRFGHFELQTGERRLLVNGAAASIGPRAFDLLTALVERTGQLLTKEELLERVWPKLVVEENNLQVQVSTLRKLLGPEAIVTVPGRGYRFTLQFERVAASGRQDQAMPSIVVLPFANVSDDVANEYFADGLSEELLNVLAKIRGLRVASRTSAFYFKGKDVDLPTVAQKLNVATILEGSVRKVGKRARIAVQLIQVATDTHLWSETYDRELDDIFAVQDDIARSAVAALRKSLLGQEPDSAASIQVKQEVMTAVKGRSDDPEAHRLYLQGQFFAERSTRKDLKKGIEYLRRAVEMDPEYALAWASLARAYAHQTGFGWVPLVEGFEHARAAAQQAIALEPDLGEAHAALGWVRMAYDWDWRAADASLRLAADLSPGNAEVVRELAWLAFCLGRQQEAIALARRCIVLDPLSVPACLALGVFCLSAGLLDDAEEAINKGLELSPDSARMYYHLGRIRMEQGCLDEALEAFRRETDATRLLGLALVQHARGEPPESDAALRELIEKHADLCALQIAGAYAYRGEADLAFEWLERAYAQRDSGLGELRSSALLRNLYGDARWQPVLEKMGLAD